MRTVLRPEPSSGEYRIPHTRPTAASEALRVPAGRRLDHVDLLRGLVMVIMVLDHVRDYLTNAHFDPHEPEDRAFRRGDRPPCLLTWS